MKVAIVGSRSFTDYHFLAKCLNALFHEPCFDITILSGGAKGADTLGALYANDRKWQLVYYLPDWDKYGKSAGFRRNELMSRAADIVIAFWDGESSGTKHMIQFSRGLGKTTIVIYPGSCCDFGH